MNDWTEPFEFIPSSIRTVFDEDMCIPNLFVFGITRSVVQNDKDSNQIKGYIFQTKYLVKNEQKKLPEYIKSALDSISMHWHGIPLILTGKHP